MSKRHRDRRPARRPPFRDPKPVILVVTEGSVTEPEYLEGFAAACHNPRVEIEIVGTGGAPMTIVAHARDLKKAAVARARRERDANIAYDEVWCVFDIDDHLRIADARQMARDNGLALAISNPCIELWLWLHFAEQPGMRDRLHLTDMLKSYMPGYDKHVPYEQCSEGYEEAARRARRLDEMAAADNDEGRNPTTGFWRLTASIREGS